MTPEECVHATKKRIGRVGGAFMLDGATFARGEEIGLKPFDFYYRGRGGVLGEVDADVVHATFFFFPPHLLRKGWERASEVMTAVQTVEEYTGCAARWADTHLAGNDDATLSRLAELLEAVADAAEPLAMPLFAGWRAQPRPTAPAFRVTLALHVLREHRGSAHTIAIAAEGLRPLEAIMAGPYGETNAKFFGWPEPYPVVDDDVRDRWNAAEALTDRLVTPAFAALPEADRVELAGLLGGLVLA